MSHTPIPHQSAAITAGVARPEPVAAGRVEEHHLRFADFAFTCRVLTQEQPVAPPLLLLGGSSQDRYSWVRHERWLGRLSSVITVDLPGYGTSDFLPARYGIDFLAAATRHMLTELGITRVNLVGACFGGAIAVRFAQHYPQMLERLMLVGMTTRVPDDYAESAARWRGMVAEGRTADIADELVQRFVSSPAAGPVRRQAAMARFLHRQFVEQGPRELEMWVEHNTRLAAHEWYRPEPLPRLPALVVTGEHDTLTTPCMGRDVARCLPAARFTTLKESDHLAPVERMAEFSELVALFCTDQPFDDLPSCNPVELIEGGFAAAGV
ncbi:alpha/beta hydrolase [Streptomyces sp. 549]|uniref:alpha/beta fold hydrolase n=1 Tax=Streptomyces sp. 549 TaxID=3049076 RepID=UPI0024C34358|nr:alpha/beta hydrolase [Streptomyces sp. 549]MDK1475806.1 alpha/beta hydrolase [Streptomyces sp. 549]